MECDISKYVGDEEMNVFAVANTCVGVCGGVEQIDSRVRSPTVTIGLASICAQTKADK